MGFDRPIECILIPTDPLQSSPKGLRLLAAQACITAAAMRPTKYEEKTESSQKSEADPSGQTGAIARYPSKFPSYPLEGTGAGLRAPLVTGNNPAPGRYLLLATRTWKGRGIQTDPSHSLNAGEKGETPEGVSPSEKYKAPAFNTDDVESQKLHLQPQYNPQGPGGGPQQLFYERPFKPFKRQVAAPSMAGSLVPLYGAWLTSLTSYTVNTLEARSSRHVILGTQLCETTYRCMMARTWLGHSYSEWHSLQDSFIQGLLEYVVFLSLLDS